MIKEIRIKTSVEENLSAGALEVTVSAEKDFEEEVFLWARITDAEGNEADRIFPVPFEEQMQFCMQVQDVRLWDAESVYLYDLILEFKDTANRILETAVKKIAFYIWQQTEEGLLVNGKQIKMRPVQFREEEDFLKKCKQSFANMIVVQRASDHDRLREHCLEYGLYLITQEEWLNMHVRKEFWRVGESAESPDKHPDFELNVVQQGVLIENKCTFQNVSDYMVECIVDKEEGKSRQVRKCSMEADIPPGSSRYIEYPFEPLAEAGKYVYRTRLIHKKDTAWASAGDAAAQAEAVIMNFFGM